MTRKPSTRSVRAILSKLLNPEYPHYSTHSESDTALQLGSAAFAQNLQAPHHDQELRKLQTGKGHIERMQLCSAWNAGYQQAYWDFQHTT